MEIGVSILNARACQKLGWGNLCVFHGRVRQGWLVADQQCGAIVLDIFGQVVIGVGELWNFELVGVGEEHHWLDDGVDLSL